MADPDYRPDEGAFPNAGPAQQVVQFPTTMRVLLLAAALVLVGCVHRDDGAADFSERGLSLRLPDGWSVSGFSETVFPRRLVAATYAVNRDDVEGDCGGLAAVQRLPPDGSYIVLIDYGGGVDADARQRDFDQRLPLTFDDGQLAEFECFGRSYAFRFIVADRALQAHVAVGRAADPQTRDAALAVLNSVRAERAP